MPKKKSLRRRLIKNGHSQCFYCGLPFTGFDLPKGSPGAAKARKYARVTLEHLNAVSNRGETIIENCALAHSWCNSKASNMPLPDKLILKETLSNNNGIPPWWAIIEKIIEEKRER